MKGRTFDMRPRIETVNCGRESKEYVLFYWSMYNSTFAFPCISALQEIEIVRR